MAGDDQKKAENPTLDQSEGDGEMGVDEVVRTAAQASSAAAMAEDIKEAGRGKSNSAFGLALGFITFAMGIAIGIPLAFLAPNVVSEYGRVALAIVLSVMFAMLLLLAIAFLLRERLWQMIFQRGEVELQRFAEPLSEVAIGAADRQPERATKAARNFAEMALARYAWVSTRRWMVASITGLIAAIAALSGSALLFEQNRLLRSQSVLLEIQNERISDQTDLLRNQTSLLDTQTQLAEADRSAQLGPEIIDIGAALAAERQLFLDGGGSPDDFDLSDISAETRARISTASLLARPYRFLAPSNANPFDDNGLIAAALAGKNVSFTIENPFGEVSDSARTELIDRSVSPERGDLLMLLLNNQLTDTELLTIIGADFSFAQVRMEILPNISLRHARLSFSDFSWTRVVDAKFGGAKIEHATFENTVVRRSDFAALTATTASPLFAMGDLEFMPAAMTGMSFNNSVVVDTRFTNSFGTGMSFVEAAVANVDFSGTSMPVADFTDGLIYQTNFEGASLQQVALDGTIVFGAGFLDMLDEQAATGTFVRDRWELEAIDGSVVSEHPRFIELSNHVDLEELFALAPFRVVRVRTEETVVQ